MRRLGGDSPPSWLIGVMLILFALVLIFVYKSQAQMPEPVQHWMIIRHGYNAYDFDCVTEYPSVDIRPMAWNPVDGFTEVSDDFVFMESRIAVSECNIDNVYMTDDGNMFVWRMSDIEREGSRYAIHVNRGAWWIEAR